MVYKGHVENGVIRVDDPVELPEGAIVRIELAVPPISEEEDSTPTLAEQLASVIGKAEGLPQDWSENHDAYLRDECRK
jgi:predicted DNA-binding antitoxin AbrB/MazE fold protein